MNPMVLDLILLVLIAVGTIILYWKKGATITPETITAAGAFVAATFKHVKDWIVETKLLKVDNEDTKKDNKNVQTKPVPPQRE